MSPSPIPQHVAFHPTFSIGRWVCGKHPPKYVMPTEAIPLNLLSKTEIYIRQKFLNWYSLSLKRDMHQVTGMKNIKVADNAKGVET